MADVVGNVKSVLAKITDAVDAAKKGWQGDASDSFSVATTNWDSEAQRLNKILDEMEKQVGVGTSTFTSMDSENQSGFTNLV